tara:strand:- start:1 stop:282 length:282 start_codon:yes stop_codon:yes gene_type:complete
MKKGYVFLTKQNIADSILGGLSFSVFMLIVAFISSLPVSWILAFIYFLTAFGFAFVVCILNYILDNFLKVYFPEIHKRSPEFKSRFKKRRRFK